jgi:transposase
MIPDDLHNRILRLHFVEGWTVGTIAKQVGVHHSTVRRVLEGQGISPKLEARPSLVDPYLPFVAESLDKWPTLPASRLFRMVQERGYTGSPSHFRRVVSRLRPRKPAEAFQRLSTLPGEQAQVDWAHCGKIQVGRTTRHLSAFVMVLSWSRMTFVRFFYDQRLGSFMAGHQAAFEALAGVPRVVLYDNLKAMVAERRGDAIRFNPTMLSFAGHYRYEPRPVAPYRGNEKGRVERRIRDLRTSFLAGRTYKDLDELNEQVTVWCSQAVAQRQHPDDSTMTVGEAWAEERARLRPLPPDDFPAHDRVEVKVGRTPYVRFDRNDYSVPHDRVRRTLVVVATPTTVRVLDGDAEVARHARSFDHRAVIEEPQHLEALVAWKREARAARGQDRLRVAVPTSQSLLEGAGRRGHNLGAATAGLLRLLDTWGAQALESAVKEAVQNDALHVAAVRQILDRRAQEVGTPPPIPVDLPNDPKVRDLHVKPHELSTYDDLGDRHE